MNFKLLAICTAILAGFSSASALDTAVLNAYCRNFLKRSPITGFSVALVKNGKTVYARGFGAEKTGGRPMTDRTIGATGSLNKSFTALAIMQLACAGMLKLDDPVTRYVPWFRTADTEESGKITLRMLLQNRSGLPSLDNWLNETEESEDAIERLLRGLSSVKMHSAPGTSYEYSNEGFDLLGLVIKKVTGKSYSDYIEENIFAPLEMERSAVNPAKIRALDAKYGIMYGNTPGIDSNVPESVLVLPGAAIPAGSVTRTTVHDLANYVSMLLADGDFKGKRLLPAGKVKELWTPGITFPAPRDIGTNGSEDWGYAMGWMTAEIDGRGLVFHGGDTGSLSSMTIIDPSSRSGITLLFNATSVSDNYRFENIYSLANNLLHLSGGEKPTTTFEPKEPDPNLKAAFTDLPCEAQKAYEGEYIGGTGQTIRCYRQDDRLVAELDESVIRRVSEVLFLNPSSIVLRSTAGTMKSAFLLDASGNPLSIATYGGVFVKLGSRDRAGYRRRNFAGAGFSALLPVGWKDGGNGRYIGPASESVSVAKGNPAVPAGFREEDGEITDSGSGRIWKETSYAGPNGRRLYRAVAMVDIPGEICQGRCFKSATHSGGNLPGIPDESLPLVL
jgi:CubicO group peptidase (beta-lactamase class C family)